MRTQSPSRRQPFGQPVCRQGAVGQPAALQADVFYFVGGVFTGAVAMQHRYRRFVLRRGIAEPFGYFVHDFAAADRAVQVGKGFRVGIDAGVGKS